MITVDLPLPAGKITIDVSDCNFFKGWAHSWRDHPLENWNFEL